ncbi:MAG TPA: MmcQ/YjbR family DNA-binding protein [Bryobacteraceae bacterium]|jgi:hypothetical protein
MTAAAFKKLALSLPETVEGLHFGVVDFRTTGGIFATLAYAKQGSGVLCLTPEQQAGMVADAPELFSPVPNGWGKRGATLVHLAKVSPEVLEGALRTAWTNRQRTKASRKPRAMK